MALEIKVALELAVVFLEVTSAAIYAVNYAVYTTAIATRVFIALGLPHACGFAVESKGVLFTLAGVVIGVGVVLLANLMKERAAKASRAQPVAT